MLMFTSCYFDEVSQVPNFARFAFTFHRTDARDSSKYSAYMKYEVFKVLNAYLSLTMGVGLLTGLW